MDTKRYDVGKWYENQIDYLLRRSGLNFCQQPKIDRHTPDFLIFQPNGPEVIIECKARYDGQEDRTKCLESQRKEAETLRRIARRNIDLYSRRDPLGNNELNSYLLDGARMDLERADAMKKGDFHSCGGNIGELFGGVYDALKEKARTYKGITDGKPYVIALYHDACQADISTALSLCFSPRIPSISWTYEGDNLDKEIHLESRWVDAWSVEEQEGIFYKYKHVSGLIYSAWERKHFFLPNPFAHIPVSADLFPFTSVPDAPLLNGSPAWVPRQATLTDDYLRPPNTYWGLLDLLCQDLRNEIKRRDA
ncbi:MAG: hypothetical protein OXE17_00565 [Chloroflexi bacterium]|nr:hypothetical protein [Chloroflexota bacterium]